MTAVSACAQPLYPPQTGTEFFYFVFSHGKTGLAAAKGAEGSSIRRCTISSNLRSRRAIREATLRGRHEQMLALIHQSEDFDPDLGGKLRELAMKFDYEGLIKHII